MTDKNILIGEIKGAHGVKGLVRVAVFADDISLFEKSTNTNITLKNKHKPYIWLAHVDGVNGKDEADALKGTKIYCDRSDFAEIKNDDMYYDDLVGRTCIDEDGNVVGEVINVQNYGAGDLLDIKPENGKSFYLSYTDENILKIDDKITVHIPEMS